VVSDQAPSLRESSMRFAFVPLAPLNVPAHHAGGGVRPAAGVVQTIDLKARGSLRHGYSDVLRVEIRLT
jgi:hypothetical protein